ncbi:MAG: hypothetical protein ABEJ36_03105 [Candidatus Nanosalina sp.]
MEYNLSRDGLLKLVKVFTGSLVIAFGVLVTGWSAMNDIFTTTLGGVIVFILGYLLSQDGVNGNRRIKLEKLRNISEHILLRDSMLALTGASLFAFGIGVLFDGLRAANVFEGLTAAVMIGLGYATCHYAIDDLPW